MSCLIKDISPLLRTAKAFFRIFGSGGFDNLAIMTGKMLVWYLLHTGLFVCSFIEALKLACFVIMSYPTLRLPPHVMPNQCHALRIPNH